MSERARPRSYSISGFDFQHDLLPLTASVSEPDTTMFGEIGEKDITLLHGKLHSWRNSGFKIFTV
jgi:hypothetical protein